MIMVVRSHKGKEIARKTTTMRTAPNCIGNESPHSPFSMIDTKDVAEEVWVVRSSAEEEVAPAAASCLVGGHHKKSDPLQPFISSKSYFVADGFNGAHSRKSLYLRVSFLRPLIRKIRGGRGVGGEEDRDARKKCVF